MIGIFVVNADDDLCFIDSEKRGGIASFIYVPDMRMCSIVFTDGTNEVVSAEIGQLTHEAMLLANEVLVVELDGSGACVFEQSVKLFRQ